MIILPPKLRKAYKIDILVKIGRNKGITDLKQFEKQSRKLHYLPRSKNNPLWPQALLCGPVKHFLVFQRVLHYQDLILLWPLQLFPSSHSFFILPHLCSFQSSLPMFLMVEHSQTILLILNVSQGHSYHQKRELTDRSFENPFLLLYSPEMADWVHESHTSSLYYDITQAPLNFSPEGTSSVFAIWIH